jgi:hypothetical protein
MGTLVFQATLGGAINLIGPNTASNVNFTLPSADGSSGQALSTNGSGTLAFGVLGILGGGTGLSSTPANGALDIGNGTGFTRTTLTAGSNVTITNSAGGISIAASSGGSPGGSTTQVQYNNAGAFGGISGVTTDGTRLTASTTIGVGGATPSTSGAGITFPATQSTSSNANTLDDYEEGTWTPTITFGGGSTGITYNTTYTGATYTKIGNRVCLSGYVILTNKGSSAGRASVSNLPFANNSSLTSVLSIALETSDITFTGQYGAYFDPGASYIALVQTTEAGVESLLSNSNFSNTSAVAFFVTYTI